MTGPRALIFDCDGVLADTERDGHRPAFNQAFAELGVPLQWDEQEYGRMLLVAGGKERIRSALSPELLARHDLPSDEESLDALVRRVHARKTELYRAYVESGKLPGRPGVARVAAEAKAAGWLVAIASTSTEESVRAVAEHSVGSEFARSLALIVAGDIVPRKKPAPDIYELALRELGVDASAAIAVEDSRNGLLAALGASIPCVVTLSSYTGDEDMSGAAVVLSSLGEVDTPARVVAGGAGAIGPLVTLRDLEASVVQGA